MGIGSADHEVTSKLTLEGNPDGLVSAMQKSVTSVKEGSVQITSAFNQIGGSVSGLIGVFGSLGGIIAGGAAFKSVISGTVSWDLETAKLAKTLGDTTENASVMKVALHTLGIDQEVVSTAALRMARTMNTNSDAFKALGVDAEAMRKSGKSNIEIMMATVTALGQYKGGLDRNQAALSIFGRSWGELQQLMRLTPAIMNEARETAERLHLVVGQEGVNSAREYKKAINELGLVQESLKVQIGRDLIPVLTELGSAFGSAGVQAAGFFARMMHEGTKNLEIDKLWAQRQLARIPTDQELVGEGWKEYQARQDAEDKLYLWNLQKKAEKFGGITTQMNKARVPGGPSADGKTWDGGSAGDSELQKQNQYIAAYNKLQDERLKGAIQGNVAFTDTDRKLAEIALRYKNLIAIYPEHRAELERNMALDSQQVKNLAESSKEREYGQAYDKLQSDRVKSAIQGNATLSDTDKKLAEVAQRYKDLIDLYPKHRAELERNKLLDEEQIKNLAAIKDAEEARLKSDEYLNPQGILGTTPNAQYGINDLTGQPHSQTTALENNSMLSTWAAAREKARQEDLQKSAEFLAMTQGTQAAELQQALSRIQQEKEAYIESWAKMTDSFEVYASRRAQIETYYTQKTAEVGKAARMTDLEFTKYSLNYAGQLASNIYELGGKKNKEMFFVSKGISMANAYVNTAEGVTKAWAQGGIWGGIGAAIVAAAGATQIALIAAQQPDSSGGSASSGSSGFSSTGTSLGSSGSSYDNSSNSVITQPVTQQLTSGSNFYLTINGAIGNKKWFDDNMPAITKDWASRNVGSGLVYA